MEINSHRKSLLCGIKTNHINIFTTRPDDSTAHRDFFLIEIWMLQFCFRNNVKDGNNEKHFISSINNHFNKC